MIKTILSQIIADCAITQDKIKKFSSCGRIGRNSEFNSVVAFLMCLSILLFHHMYKSKLFL